MDSDEGVYLLHTREFVNTKQPIFKLGRSNQLDNRVKQYPNGSKIMLMLKCKNSKSCEINLLNLFKTKFIQKKYYGNEYFEGNYIDMIKEICDYVNNVNSNFTEEIVLDVVGISVADVVDEGVVAADVVDVVDEGISVVDVATVGVSVAGVAAVDVAAATGVAAVAGVAVAGVASIDVAAVAGVSVNNSKKCDRTCPKCKTKFRYPSTLKIHLESSSRCSMNKDDIELFLSTIKPVIIPVIEPVIINNNPTICKYCNVIYSRKASLKRHLQKSSCSKYQNKK